MHNNPAHTFIVAKFMRNLFQVLRYTGQKASPHCPAIQSQINDISGCIENLETLQKVTQEELSQYQALINQAFSDELNAGREDPNHWRQ